MTRTTKIRVHGRRAGIGNDSDGSPIKASGEAFGETSEAVRGGRAPKPVPGKASDATLPGRCGGPPGGVLIGFADGAGALVERGGGALEVLAARCARGGAAEIGRGMTTPGAVTGAAAGASWRCGKRSSSEIFCVGATRDGLAERRAPQPPQNRESGALSVPQLGQRIS